jgi:predicted permease
MRRLFRFPWRSRDDIRRDVDTEFQFHLDARTEELVASGVPPADARRQALADFGDLNDARSYIHHIDRRTESSHRRQELMTGFRQDTVHALRRLRRSPGFTIVAILTLALGIGANTAIFSVVNGVLLRPLPFPRPEQLLKVWSESPSAGLAKAGVSPVDLDDWRAQRKQIADIGGFWYAAGGSGIDLTGLGEPLRLSAVFFTPGFFTSLGIQPASGRLPREDEMVRGGPDKVVLLTHAFWQRQFGGAANVVNSHLTLGGNPYLVLGVLPASLRFPADEVDVYVPYSTIPDESIPRLRPVRILEVVARTGDGVALDGATAELNAIAARLAKEYPENAAWGAVSTQPLRDAITGDVRRSLLLLRGAVAFVLLIACVNVASLLLARASVREREIAVRSALGAGRGRIVRQMLTESTVLSLAGGIAGLLLGLAGTRALVALSAGQLPRGAEVSVDAPVLVFTLGASILTGLLFGLVPALRASSGNLQTALRAAGRGITGDGGNRLRHGLVVAEVALAMMLVVGGGLMTRSFVALLRVDPGFRPDQLLVLNFTLSTSRHENYQQLYGQILERARAVPGVVAAGVMKDAPFRGTGERNGFTLPGMVVPAGTESPTASMLHVSDGVFGAIGARMVAGREFTSQDTRDAPPVVVINEAFAKRWFPGERPVGKYVMFGPRRVEVVGVVNDIRQRAMSTEAEPTMYIHVQQNGRVRMNLMVRTRGEPLAMIGALREAVWSVDRQQPITSVFTFDEAMRDSLARPRLLTVLLGIFGALGLLLGAVGLYGVLAYVVSQRQRDIGVRLALGARPGAVLQMIVKRGLVLALAGVAVGVAGSLALGRLLSTVLYDVTPGDPLTLMAVTAVLLVVAALASWIPARRAARMDPVVTLREE